MSLGVYLTTNEPVTRRGTGVFVRDGGKTKELSPDEVLDRWPDADVTYKQFTTDEVFHANVTHNLGLMAREAGIYEALWRPEEKGWTHAKQLISPLETGLEALIADPTEFKKLNPDNGWGSYDGLVEFVKEYLEACREYPDAEIEVSR